MRVVIVGAGEVGSSIAASLADSHEVVVVDIDRDRVESLQYEVDVLAIQGDGGSLETLEEAEIADADMLIASTDDDETNLVTCGTAKTINPDCFTISRVKNTKFLETWRHAEGAFGVDFMVGTNLLTAQTIVSVIGLPAANDVESFVGGRVQMAEFRIDSESPIAGQTIQEADRFESLTFAGLVRDGDVIIPDGSTRIQADDEVVVIGSRDSVRQFATEVSTTDEDDPSDVLIVGGSDIGFHTARLLESRGLKPRLIERNHDHARELAESLPGTTVMESDATDREFLEREHIGEVDVVVAALDNDEKSLLAGLLAKRLGAERAVAVVDAGEYVDLFEAVGIDVAVNPREATAEEITRFTRERKAENVAIIEHDQAEVIEIEVDTASPLVGRPIREAIQDLPDGVVFGAITRDDEYVVPRGDTILETDDHVVLFVGAGVVEQATGQF